MFCDAEMSTEVCMITSQSRLGSSHDTTLYPKKGDSAGRYMQVTLLAFSVTKEPKCQERKYSCIYFSSPKQEFTITRLNSS